MSTSKLFDAYATDADAEENGAWTTLRGGARVKIRSENSHVVREGARKLDKKYRSILMAESGLPAEIQDERDIALVGEFILVDWDVASGITNEKGEPLPFSKENAKWLCDALPGFRRDVVWAARTDDTFKAEQVAAMAENSDRPSGITPK